MTPEEQRADDVAWLEERSWFDSDYTPVQAADAARYRRILAALTTEQEPVAWKCPECGSLLGWWATECDGPDNGGTASAHVPPVPRALYHALGYIMPAAPQDQPSTDAGEQT